MKWKTVKLRRNFACFSSSKQVKLHINSLPSGLRWHIGRKGVCQCLGAMRGCVLLWPLAEILQSPLILEDALKGIIVKCEKTKQNKTWNTNISLWFYLCWSTVTKAQFFTKSNTVKLHQVLKTGELDQSKIGYCSTIVGQYDFLKEINALI